VLCVAVLVDGLVGVLVDILVDVFVGGFFAVGFLVEGALRGGAGSFVISLLPE
jgi:hypothetical protein